ncbi:MAG: hypothetical protein AAB569_03195 [Patescibacteria group bacterium]
MIDLDLSYRSNIFRPFSKYLLDSKIEKDIPTTHDLTLFIENYSPLFNSMKNNPNENNFSKDLFR